MIKSLIRYTSIIIIVILFSLLICNFLPYMFPSIGTKYSENYDVTMFETIEIGDSQKKVDSMLGKPLKISTNNSNIDSLQTVYWYSKGTSILFLYEQIRIDFYEDKVISKSKFLSD